MMSMRKLKPLKMMGVTFCLLSTLATFCVAADEEKSETSDVPAPLQFPTGPSDYVNFDDSAQLNFAIDLNSILFPSTNEQDEKKEIRYALKATSKQGAVNVSYEGIRCDTYQKILYATGRSGGSWHTISTPTWGGIPKTGINAAHIVLARDFFCEGRTIAGSVNTIRDRIKWNRPLNN